MLTESDMTTLEILMLLCAVLTIFLNYVSSRKKKKQLDKIFIIIFVLFIFWMAGLILQIFFSNIFHINPMYFDYFVYIFVCFMPVAFLFMALIFTRTKIKFKDRYMLLFVIPILSLLVLWTNDFHHLFYEVYSTDFDKTVYGPYFYYVHSIYTYLLFGITVCMLIKYSVKNSSFFSKQSLLFTLGVLIPVVINILGTFNIVKMSIYITPISLTFTIICFSLAIFRFNLFKLTPIALQSIVDRISDSYIVLNEENLISDFNKTFITTFHVKNASNIRGKSLDTFFEDYDPNIKKFNQCIKKVESNNETESFEIYIESIEKYFNVEITSIIVNKQFLGILVLFKDITQHVQDMKNIEKNRDMLIEQERLASLGQMIGGIAHNLKTPIFSITGGLEGLSDLVNEYDASIDNVSVTNNDMHEIAKDMREWITKLKNQNAYMSDIITTIKGQAVTLSGNESIDFSITELFKRVDILMKHEIKNALAMLKIENNVGNTEVISGNINSLVQIINNIISNAIEAYGNDYNEKKIELVANRDSSNIIISIKDYGPGISERAQKKLFKEMITTKGKNGTGLGLFISYSNIKAHFNGDLTYETELGKGTTFYIILPVN